MVSVEIPEKRGKGKMIQIDLTDREAEVVKKVLLHSTLSSTMGSPVDLGMTVFEKNYADAVYQKICKELNGSKKRK